MLFHRTGPDEPIALASYDEVSRWLHQPIKRQPGVRQQTPNGREIGGAGRIESDHGEGNGESTVNRRPSREDRVDG